jgi:alkylresorcinol/alkylpyrone synthase
MSYILSVGTALPEYLVTQQQAAQFAQEHFNGRLAHQGQLMAIFENARIAERHFIVPLAWFASPDHSLKERNDLYIAGAEALALSAAQRALERAACAPDDVDFVVFVSTTGLATPSIDARLIARLGMRPTTKRLPIWGLGCAGGVAGLARAAEHIRAFSDALALLVAVETCSITFQFHDYSKKNLVATAIFADGAAAVLIGGERWARQHPDQVMRYVAAYSHLFPNSERVMGWDVVDTGLSVVFAPEIPARIARDMRPVVASFLAEHGLALTDVARYVLHPGGARVLDAYAEAFGLDDHALHDASEVLRAHGNMSSPTVLFVLERAMQVEMSAGQYVLMGALGPGFSAELALLQSRVF